MNLGTEVDSSCLRALLAGSVDYAGLFPPAALALEPALENHAAYVRNETAWMLGCFVLPAAKLAEAEPLLAGRFDPARPLRISALGTKTGSPDEFLVSLGASLAEVARFGSTHRKNAVTACLESPLPQIHPGPELRMLLKQAAEIKSKLVPEPLRMFWEVPWADGMRETLRCVAQHNAEAVSTARSQPFGVKLRTGGLEASDFPSPERLAVALLAARDAKVGLKFTAGLHHPIRHFDVALDTRMHGFLNVFAAGVLAREHLLDLSEIQAILQDEDPASFRFDAREFAWRNRHVPTGALPAHRQFINSFGSCSFEEPCDDLRGLGLLA